MNPRFLQRQIDLNAITIKEVEYCIGMLKVYLKLSGPGVPNDWNKQVSSLISKRKKHLSKLVELQKELKKQLKAEYDYIRYEDIDLGFY